MLTRELRQLEKQNQHSRQEALVAAYKSTGECEELIQQYKPFLDSYVALFEYGTLHLTNRSVRIFVSKFTGGSKSEKRRYENSAKYAISQPKSSAFALQMLSKIRAVITKEELYNDLLVTLLILARRYVFKDRNFTSYISTAFPHELYRQIQHLHADVALNAQSYHDPMSEGGKPLTISMEEQRRIALNLDADLELMHPDWLSGETAQEPFKSMSRSERLVIAKYYEPRGFRKIGAFAKLVSDREIGQLTGRNRKSIQRVRTRVVKKLTDEWGESKEEWVRIRKNY